MATKKPSNKITITLTKQQADRLYDFVNVVHIRRGRVVTAMYASGLLRGNKSDDLLWRKLTEAGVTGLRSHDS